MNMHDYLINKALLTTIFFGVNYTNSKVDNIGINTIILGARTVWKAPFLQLESYRLLHASVQVTWFTCIVLIVELQHYI